MPAQFVEFLRDGSRAELIPNPPLTPKDTYTYKFYHSDFKTSTLPGTSVQIHSDNISKLYFNGGLKSLDTKDAHK